MIARLWPFILGNVALGIDAYVIAGLLPAMADDLGSTTGVVGLGVTAFTGAYALAGPLLAGIAGREAGRGLGIALLVFTLGNLLTVAAPGIALYLVARVIAGAAAGVYSPLATAVAAASVPGESRGRALGLVLAGLATGTVFGVPLGLWLGQLTSWRVSILVIAVVGVASLVGVVVRNTRGAALPNIDSPPAAARLRSLTRPTTLLTVLVTFFTGIASLGLYTYIAEVLADTGLRDHQTLGIWVWGLGGAVGVLLIGRIVDRVRVSLRVTVVILLGLLVALLILGTGPAVWLLVIVLAAWGALGWASLAPQQDTLLRANPTDGATAVAAESSANYLGSAVGSALGSVALVAGVGGTSLAFLAAIPVALALVVHLVRMRM
ncbi:MAG TPA: MFS transporter [Candidatus Corynebacterium avicola]|uniref:MFS transporter n=1 Tax=Candidatus Corynebacterium avicola TaxID=2838527 RepID=A0A9D1RNJ9_9CORY|nr:MFS transporter [Candidatus Corynebacterium avicola]